MKKLLLTGTVIAGLATVAAPTIASANLDMEIGGFMRGYGVHADNDLAGAASERALEFRHDTEVHVGGETTLDNGLTVGAHTELDITGAGAAGGVTVEEVYGYFSGSWGRVNFGREDGAQYLLQVAAPSADSNVDGLRVNISGLNTAAWDASLVGINSVARGDVGILSYGADMARGAFKLTYITPTFNGFQAAVSYAPEVGGDDTTGFGSGLAAASLDNNGGLEDLMEIGARWDGEFSGVGLSLGAGFSTASQELTVAGVDDTQEWNAGMNVAFSGFSFGAAYVENNNGVATNGDTTRLVFGLGWDNGPWTAGASYQMLEHETGAATSTDVDAYTVGGSYAYGPGMTFRGAVQFGEADDSVVGTADESFTQVTLGTEINF